MAAPSAPIPVVLIIADISGYTRFMVANSNELVHAQSVVGDLVATIIKQVEIPLEVAKLEGDAVFLWAPIDADPAAWDRHRELISSRLLLFYATFARRVAELAGSAGCTCGACKNIDQLRLKVVAHVGEAVIHDVAGFRELAGVDVIVVHRLLKNEVKSKEYVLWTEAAARSLGIPQGTDALVEDCEGVGPVNVHVWYADGVRPAAKADFLARPVIARAWMGVSVAVHAYAFSLRKLLAGPLMFAGAPVDDPIDRRWTTFTSVIGFVPFLFFIPMLSLLVQLGVIKRDGGVRT
jgi:hypothetical protein